MNRIGGGEILIGLLFLAVLVGVGFFAGIGIGYALGQRSALRSLQGQGNRPGT